MQCIDYWQEFSSDMGSRTVKRIADVSNLRNYQFPQVTFFCFSVMIIFVNPTVTFF